MTPSEQIAAVAPIAEVILPGEATSLEKALLAVELASLANVDPAIIASIWNPATCPPALLPWLAWALSVDVWDNSWTEQRKRKVIAASPVVHRLKGTRGAVSRSLAAFDLESDIVEWWQSGGRRGTFRVDMLYADGSPEYDVVTQQQALLAVKAAKPKSRVFTARAVVTSQASPFIGAMTIHRFAVTALPYAFTGAQVDGAPFVGVMAANFFDTTISPKAA